MRWIVALALVLLGSSDAFAQAEGAEKGQLGVGVIVGEPTGISAKLYLADDTAIDGAIGWALAGGGLHVHGDFLWHPWILTDEDTFVLPAYLGPGLRVNDQGGGRAESEFHVGVRGVVGMLFDFKTVPIDVFVEAAAVVDWVFADIEDDDGLKLGLNGGAGARYYF